MTKAMKLTYNDAYMRMMMLSAARQFATNGKTISEILLLKSAYTPVLAEFENKKQVILADKEADDETKQKTLNAVVLEPCSAPDRRLSLEAFENIADKVLATSEPVVNFNGDKLAPDFWLEVLFANLVEQPAKAEAAAEGEGDVDILPHDRPDKEE